MSYQEQFWIALNEENPLSALHRTIVNLRQQGVPKETLLNELQSFRQLAAVRSEQDEDVVLDMMDYFYYGDANSYIE